MHLSESVWQESAGSLVLLAAAEATGLVKTLDDAVAESSVPRLSKSYRTTRQQLMLTLLFMNIFEVQRPWDLRSYSGDGLALLSGRERTYGYAHTERFLTQIAQSGAAERLTTSMAQWTHQVWSTQARLYYVDGHKKPVYSDCLLPRGLVGRFGKILSCRSLTLLMDSQGHPLLVLTARGDQHLTTGLPAVVESYEQAVGQGKLATLIVDREGMSGPFLKNLSAEHTVITLLRADQYQGLESFSMVGDFVPLEFDRQGKVLREVAPAQFSLTIPDQPETPLPLSVALIRDWRQQLPVPLAKEARPPRWNADLDRETRWQWTLGHFEATPAPAVPTQPKLIPIVSTATTLTPLELAQIYRQRWVAQENIIRDFLLPMGLDVNHGYTKTRVENSEVAKRRNKLQKQRDNAYRRAQTALRKHDWNAKRGDKLWAEAKAYSDQQYRQLNLRLSDPIYEEMDSYQRKAIVRQERDLIDPEIDRRFQLAHRTLRRSEDLWLTYEQSCALQRQCLRDLDTLDHQERAMYEIDNTKDHLMSVLKLMLVNLLMWSRDRFFPAHYAHATTTRLLPFFRLPGHVLTTDDHVIVTLRPFNDRGLNRDLLEFCQRVNDAHLCLPTGKSLVYRSQQDPSPISNRPP